MMYASSEFSKFVASHGHDLKCKTMVGESGQGQGKNFIWVPFLILNGKYHLL